MNAIKHDDTPNEKWGLKKLGQFCAERRQRSALDTVLIGRAIILAKGRCQKEGKGFTDWKKEHGFSNATASRYMRLAMACENKDFLERLKTVGPLEAYIEAGIEAPRTKNPRQASVRSAARAKPATVINEPQPPSWAVPDADKPEEDRDKTDRTIELQTRKECLKFEMREIVPAQVEFLKDKIVSVMKHDVQTLIEALPETKSEKEKMATEIDSLRHMLSRLTLMLRDDDAIKLAAKNMRQKAA